MAINENEYNEMKNVMKWWNNNINNDKKWNQW